MSGPTWFQAARGVAWQMLSPLARQRIVDAAMFTGTASEGALIDTAMNYGIKKYDQRWTKKHGKSIKNVFGSKAATSSRAPHEPMSGRKGHKRKQDNPQRSSRKRFKLPVRRSISFHVPEPHPSTGTQTAPSRRMSVPVLRPRRLAGKRKAISLPRVSSQYRFQHHLAITQEAAQKALWYGGSSLGSGQDAAKVLADAMICHYLRRLNDNRSSRSTSTLTNKSLWHKMDIYFGTVGEHVSDTGNELEEDTSDDTDKGLTLTNSSVDVMVPILALKLEKMFIFNGFVPIRVSVRKNDSEGSVQLSTRQILDDTDCYRNQFAMSISGLFKIHNVSLPGDGSVDKHSINAQPIDGKLYNFRNRVPILHPTYLAGLSSPGSINGVSEISDTNNMLIETPTGIKWDELNTTTANPTELQSPPLRPSVIFKNAVSSEKVYMAPGALKYRKTYFAMEGSLMAIFKRIYPHRRVRFIPPGGDCFMMCLKPTLKVSNDEVVKIDTDHSHVFKAHCKRAKMLYLPTVQNLQ